MTPEISLPKEAKKIYRYDTLTEHMWFGFIKCGFVGRGIILPPQEEHLHISLL